MDKFLRQLLEQNDKVILPDFGAIVIEDKEQGNLMFNEYLKYNDGNLDELLAKKSNMDLQEAQNSVAKYVRDIQLQLDKGESYDIYGLGSFSKNSDGEIEFEGSLGEESSSFNEPGASQSNDAPEREEETTVSDDQKKDTPEVSGTTSSDEKKESASPDATPSPDEHQKDASAEKSSTSTSKNVASKKANKKDKEASKSKDASNQKKSKKSSTKKTSKQKDTKKSSAGKKKKEKKRKTNPVLWIVLIIVILAGAGATYVYFNYDEVESYMGWDEFDKSAEDKNKTLAENSGDTETGKDSKNGISEDEKQVGKSKDNAQPSSNEDPSKSEDDNKGMDEANDQKDSKKTASASEDAKNGTNLDQTADNTASSSQFDQSSNGNYHLIAGTFKQHANAKGLVASLKSKGLDAKIIGKLNGMHYVSAQSFPSARAAKNAVNTVRQKAPDAWIYKY